MEKDNIINAKLSYRLIYRPTKEKQRESCEIQFRRDEGSASSKPYRIKNEDIKIFLKDLSKELLKSGLVKNEKDLIIIIGVMFTYKDSKKDYEATLRMFAKDKIESDTEIPLFTIQDSNETIYDKGNVEQNNVSKTTFSEEKCFKLDLDKTSIIIDLYNLALKRLDKVYPYSKHSQYKYGRSAGCVDLENLSSDTKGKKTVIYKNMSNKKLDGIFTDKIEGFFGVTLEEKTAKIQVEGKRYDNLNYSVLNGLLNLQFFGNKDFAILENLKYVFVKDFNALYISEKSKIELEKELGYVFSKALENEVTRHVEEYYDLKKIPFAFEKEDCKKLELFTKNIKQYQPKIEKMILLKYIDKK